jgi:hypothetical protein
MNGVTGVNHFRNSILPRTASTDQCFPVIGRIASVHHVDLDSVSVSNQKRIKLKMQMKRKIKLSAEF